VDEILSSRESTQSEVAGRMKNIFLRETEGICGSLKNTTIIAATNRVKSSTKKIHASYLLSYFYVFCNTKKPWVIDKGAWSRFQKSTTFHFHHQKREYTCYSRKFPNYLTI